MVLDKSASNVNQNLMKQSKSETYERLIVICIILGHIAIGYSMGSTSPIMDVLTQTFSLNSAQRSLIGSSTLIGNVFGSLIGGFLADQFGRKKTLLVAWYLLIIACTGQSLSTKLAVFIFFRMFAGFVTGTHYSGITTYLSEQIDDSKLNNIMSITELTFFLGIFLSFGAGFLFNALFNTNNTWRALIFTNILIVAPAIYIMHMYLKESPVWLANRKKKNTKQDNNDEICSLNDSITSKRNLWAITFVSVYWAGIASPSYCVAAFSISIINSLHLKYSSHLINSFMGFFGIFGVLLGMLMLKQVGTKKTLLVSLFSTATPLLLLSLLLRLFNSTTLFLQIASIALLVMYNVSCNLPAPLCLIYPAKLFPSSIKGTASGICGMVARISTILCMFALGHAIEKVETNAVFLSIAGLLYIVCILCAYLAPTDALLNRIYEEYQSKENKNQIETKA